MKTKKKLINVLTGLLLCCALLFTAACFGGGNPPVVRDLSDKLVAVVDETFASADFAVGTGKDDGGANAKAFGATFSVTSTPTIWYKLELITSNFMGQHGGVPLTENNKKALKGEAMSLGSTFSGMTKALIEVYGDKVFEKNYAFSQVTFSVAGENEAYTISGVMREADGKMRSGVRMNFEKHDNDDYSYSYVQYNVNDDDTIPSSNLTIAAYYSGVGILRAELESENSNVFSNYDTAYDEFKINKITASYFELDNYASNASFESTTNQRKLILDFAKEQLGFSNATYAELCGINTTARMTDSEAITVGEFVEKYYFVSPYYYETNDSYVRDSYRVPNNITVIKTGSIPATKKLYVHPYVTLIESRPFLQPQYLEKIVFEEPSGGRLAQIGSFDQSTGKPTFILSMTKVKNFTLPSSVKKLELGEYVLNTYVENLDLSNYDPSWLKNTSEFTYDFDENSSGKNNYTDRNNAYTTLEIGGTQEYFYKEIRYIENLKMPKFNMGIKLSDVSHLRVVDANGEEYYSEAHQDVGKCINAFEGSIKDWAAQMEYHRAFEVIDTLTFNQTNNIVPESLLYSDIDEDKGIKKRNEFAIELYYDTMSSVLYETFDPPVVYSSVNYILLNAGDYQSAIEEEQRQYASANFQSAVSYNRAAISIDGATELNFGGIDCVYLVDGTVALISELAKGESFIVPNVAAADAIKTINDELRYFVGWSYTENGDVDVYPFETAINHYQTFYPVYSAASTDLIFTNNGNDTYSAKFVGSEDVDGAIIIPSTYNGKPVTEIVENSNADRISADIVIFGEGIKVISANAIRAESRIVYPSSIEKLVGDPSWHILDEFLFENDNLGYIPVGQTPFGAVIKMLSSSDFVETLTMHQSAVVIAREAFMGANTDEIIIPENVKYIGINAFEFSTIKTATIPSNVRSVEQLFIGCDKLETVEILAELTIIPDNMFNGCSNLKTVIIPSSVEVIGADAFYGCNEELGTVYNYGRYLGNEQNPYLVYVGFIEKEGENLTFELHADAKILYGNFNLSCYNTVNMGDKISYVGAYVFDSYTYISTINYAGSQKDWSEIVFDDTNDAFDDVITVNYSIQ